MKQELIEKLLKFKAFDIKTDERYDTEEKIKEIQFAVIFGDPKGDTFVEKVQTEEELKETIKKHLSGDTHCHFLTEIYHIIINGEEGIYSIDIMMKK
jgi:hypothetical protein